MTKKLSKMEALPASPPKFNHAILIARTPENDVRIIETVSIEGTEFKALDIPLEDLNGMLARAQFELMKMYIIGALQGTLLDEKGSTVEDLGEVE